jgi:putative chitinase
MGNGDAQSGDGWRFRGRGLIQLTGRTAYQKFAAATNQGLDEATQAASTPAGATDSAIWFWYANGLSKLAAAWSIDMITERINGGMSAAAERRQLCEVALRALGN